MITSSTSRRQRRAGQLLDEHGSHLLAMAHTLTTTTARAERLVIDTIQAQSGLRRRGSQRTRGDLSTRLHDRWLGTHGPRSRETSTLRTRAQDLSDLQLGLLALVLFSGYTYVRAGHGLGLSPHETATALRDGLRSLGA